MFAVPGEITSPLSRRLERAAQAGRDTAHRPAGRARALRPERRGRRRRGGSAAAGTRTPRAHLAGPLTARRARARAPGSPPTELAGRVVRARARGRSWLEGEASIGPGRVASRAMDVRTGSRSPARRCRAHRSRASADVEIVGGGITGCSCALALAEAGLACVCTRRARSRPAPAAGTAASRSAAAPWPYDSARDWLGARAGARVWRADRGAPSTGWRDSPAMLPSRTGSLRLARTTTSATSSAPSTRRCASDGFAAEWLEDLPEPLAGRSRRRPPSGRRRAAACALVGGWRASPPRRASSSVSTIASTISTRSTPTRRRRHRRVRPSGLLPRARRADHPDSRPDDRHRAAAGAPLRPMPHYGRHGYDYWHQLPDADPRGRLPRLSISSPSSRRGRRRRGSRAHSRDFVERDPRPPARGHPSLGRHLRDGAGPDARRRARARTRRALGRRRLLRATATCSACCRRLVAHALLGDRDPIVEILDPARARLAPRAGLEAGRARSPAPARRSQSRDPELRGRSSRRP